MRNSWKHFFFSFRCKMTRKLVMIRLQGRTIITFLNVFGYRTEWPLVISRDQPVLGIRPLQGSAQDSAACRSCTTATAVHVKVGVMCIQSSRCRVQAMPNWEEYQTQIGYCATDRWSSSSPSATAQVKARAQGRPTLSVFMLRCLRASSARTLLSCAT